MSTAWKRTATTPWIAGEFRWCGFDYIGEAPYKGGHWPVRAENFGIIDFAGIPKEDYFLYKAFWTSTPMVHLLPHWTH
jgi:beta-galactosidase